MLQFVPSVHFIWKAFCDCKFNFHIFHFHAILLSDLSIFPVDYFSPFFFLSPNGSSSFFISITIFSDHSKLFIHLNFLNWLFFQEFFVPSFEWHLKDDSLLRAGLMCTKIFYWIIICTIGVTSLNYSSSF